MKYRCLLIDHDDTAVESTASIHYPAHLETLRLLRPGWQPPGLDGWFRRNFHPGLMAYLVEELKMTEEEIAEEFRIWRRYVAGRVPPFFPGFLETLREFRRRGGRVAVISHSETDIIERDYRQADPADPFLPDLIFGWTFEEERRKPSPWPALRALEEFGLSPAEALIVDDLKPGVLMSQASGIPVAGAGWGHRVPEIAEYMRRHCLRYFTSVGQLRDFLLSPAD